MQSRVDSFMEGLTNVAIGFAINTAINITLMPHVFGMAPTAAPLVGFAAIMTLVSFARAYILRRAFDGKSVWQAIKGRLNRPGYPDHCVECGGPCMLPEPYRSMSR